MKECKIEREWGRKGRREGGRGGSRCAGEGERVRLCVHESRCDCSGPGYEELISQPNNEGTPPESMADSVRPLLNQSSASPSPIPGPHAQELTEIPLETDSRRSEQHQLSLSSLRSYQRIREEEEEEEEEVQQNTRSVSSYTQAVEQGLKLVGQIIVHVLVHVYTHIVYCVIQ